MMQNVITSAFETVTTVEGGVELLDIFMHLSSREVGLEIPLPPFYSLWKLSVVLEIQIKLPSQIIPIAVSFTFLK